MADRSPYQRFPGHYPGQQEANHYVFPIYIKVVEMEGQPRKARVYFIVTIIAMVICWSPFNVLAYVAPFIVLALLILLGRSGRLIKRTLAWVWLWLIMMVFYSLINSEFQFGNAIVAFVTWAGIIVLLLIPVSEFNSPLIRHKLERFAWKILLVEAVWGITQGIYGYIHSGSFDSANGDYVEGTIHPPLPAELAYSNVMFAINIALLLLFLLPSIWRGPRISRIIIYTLGTVVFVMASVVHTIFFLLAAGGISALLVWGRRPQFSRIVGSLVVFGAIGFLAWVLLPNNLGTARSSGVQLLRGEEPKSVSVVTAIRKMPAEYPYISIIGLGPGQYVSRAGLMSTGLYFGGLKNPKKYPFLPNQLTKAQEKYLLPLWEWKESNPYWGSTHVPYFSWLAVYTEFGLLGWSAVLLVLFYLLKTILSMSRKQNLEKFVLLSTLGFMFLLGFQENNWEVPQAWFSGLLLIRILYRRETQNLFYSQTLFRQAHGEHTGIPQYKN